MKLVDRMKIANACKESVTGKVTVLPAGALNTQPYTTVHIDWPTISVMFDIGGVNAPGACLHYFNAKRDLQHHRLFDSINTVHRRKATGWIDDVKNLPELLKKVEQAVSSNEVFVTENQCQFPDCDCTTVAFDRNCKVLGKVIGQGE